MRGLDRTPATHVQVTEKMGKMPHLRTVHPARKPVKVSEMIRRGIA